jgi:hypothetical protein
MRWLAWRLEPTGPRIRAQVLPNTKASMQSDPLRHQQLPVNGRRPSADGALCRPLLMLAAPRRLGGREQPPGLDRVSTPTPARRVAHAPKNERRR